MDYKILFCDQSKSCVLTLSETTQPIYCCGTPMKELKGNSVDGALEKHVPVYKVENNKLIVNVGEIDHPMDLSHYIEWIFVETNEGVKIKNLKPGDHPRTCFALNEGEEVKRVIAYCNLHSLWESK